MSAPALGAAALTGCGGDPHAAYERAADRVWRPFDSSSDRRAVFGELVRYATLAPSSHNTQCWTFETRRDRIVIRPDLARRCPVVDPDDHHLFVTLGCSAENIVQAASQHGYRGEVFVDTADGDAVVVMLRPAPLHGSALFDAIPFRQNSRGAYDRAPLPADEMRALERAGTGPGVRVETVTSPERRDAVRSFVVEGNTAEDSDPAFVSELRRWIRFNDAEALASGDGLLSRLSGSPAMPGWVGRALLGAFLAPTSDGDRYAALVRDSAAIAIFVSERDDVHHRVEAGRAYQRFALRATLLGIRVSMLNQAVEVAPVRARFAAAFGLTGRPDLVVRFGRGPLLARSLRRPVSDVLVA